ncbi:hypothetical protein BASA50_002122 [Batrachochytrium salamandrivorans]|uniref:Uncharacterized protein n=1 Tax=Batrachochytrium salamandrivorans TaxID=1357716 RepID=A0ABQ8FLY4_9FUNG|nr:hypothetical protein BASA60_008152 [Batrachochytrium salamandrivorans]KAH6575077.1 hypothetical protein BASA62_002114 [Batrachochytrium salamandrivorans]KAH6600558.1 hypothetical protein BASA50_002122 [Batrachochytrium salamandrivorans]KAH6602484.1 hypothetical protein BASA61_001091 [Batrachochytrium salamandrivorans]KAH9255958.1 hypothetical protein BASA81_005995 [Batrachochytrium salamandrivorans]
MTTLSLAAILMAVSTFSSVAGQQTVHLGAVCGGNIMPVNMCAAPLICARAPGANPDLQGICISTSGTLSPVGGPCSSFMVTSPRCYVGLVCMGGTLPGMMGTCQTSTSSTTVATPATATANPSASVTVSGPPASSVSGSVHSSTASPAPGPTTPGQSAAAEHSKWSLTMAAAMVVFFGALFA